jgi:hypothetical protein
MAVPAQEERLRGANPTSELALAGAINVLASDDLSCDPADVWVISPPSSTRRIIHLLSKLSTIFCD